MKEIEKSLAEYGFYMTTTEGNSMATMIKTGDRIVVRKPTFPLKKYDIPVYRRDGHYTMHRIVRVTKSGYVICGDNRIHLERDITDKDIVGVFCGMYRDGKFIEADELVSYGIKACHNFPIRKCVEILGKIKTNWKNTLRIFLKKPSVQI